MIRPLLLCLLSLSFLAACKKEDDGPSLQGRWNMQTSYYYDCDKNGNRISGRTDQVDSLGAYQLISDDKIEFYTKSNQLAGGSDYTREGNVLHIQAVDLTTLQVRKYDLTIDELTDQRFSTRFTSPRQPTTGAYFLSGNSYTR